MADKWVLVLTNRETGKVRRLEFDSPEERAAGMNFDVHKEFYKMVDPELPEVTDEQG